MGRPGIDPDLQEKIKEKARCRELSAYAIARMKGKVGATKVRELVREVRG